MHYYLCRLRNSEPTIRKTSLHFIKQCQLSPTLSTFSSQELINSFSTFWDNNSNQRIESQYRIHGDSNSHLSLPTKIFNRLAFESTSHSQSKSIFYSSISDRYYFTSSTLLNDSDDKNGLVSEKDKKGKWRNWISKRMDDKQTVSTQSSQESKASMDETKPNSNPNSKPQSIAKDTSIDMEDIEDSELIAWDDDGEEEKEDDEEEEEEGENATPGNDELSADMMKNMKVYDLEEEEEKRWDQDTCYRFRPDRIYFPGQTYRTEDIDLSLSASSETSYAFTSQREAMSPKHALRKADFRNVRFLLQFTSETGKILPKHRSKLSSKAQRKVAREIRLSRVMGLMPFTNLGKPRYRFDRILQTNSQSRDKPAFARDTANFVPRTPVQAPGPVA